MSNFRTYGLSFICTFLVLHSISRAADSYSVGQKVEVREGDSWSPASVIAHEGRKYQVHYDGADASSDEWVTTDRIRQPGAVSATGAAQPTGVASGPSNAGFNIGDNIEAKWGGIWRKASVVNKTGNWTMVEYDNVWYEWVQPWRLRQIGSSVDSTLDSNPRPFVDKSAPAPAESPTAGTSDPDAFHISETIGAEDLPILKVSLAGHEITASRVQGPPSPDARPTGVDPKVLPLHQPKAADGSKLDLLTTPQGKFAAVMTVPSDWHQPALIQRIDLEAGTAGNVITLPSRLIPLAINDDGTRLITRSDKFFPATKWRLDLWAIDGEAVKPLLSFRPYPQDANGNDRVLWASWLDASHLLTCSGGHTLSLWDISDTNVKQIYTLHGDSTAEPRLSAGGKYVTAGYGRAIVVIEALSGKCVARCGSSTGLNQMTSCINPEVTRVALCGGSRLILCDLQSGKLISDVGLPVGVSGADVDWIAPNLLLIDKRWIYDCERHAMVWEFTSDEQPPIACWMGDRLWTLLNDADPALVSVDLLNSSVLAADKQLSNAEYAIPAGSKVSLQINVPCDSQERDKLVATLTLNAKRAGLIIADNQPIQLVADSKDIDPRKVTYHGRGFDRGTSETVTVSNTVQLLSLVMDSKPVWSVNSGVYNGAPMIVIRKRGETVAQALESQKKSKTSWFTTVGIPKAVIKSSEQTGSSSLTENAGTE